MPRARILAAATLAVAALSAAFVMRDRRPSHGEASASRESSVELEGLVVGGCDEVLSDATCTVTATATLTLFVPTAAVARVHAGGTLLTPKERVVLDGGQRITVALPTRSATALDVEVDSPPRRASVRLAPAPPPPAWLVSARAAKARGDLEAARAALASRDAKPGAGERDDADAEAFRARLTLMAGDSEGGAKELARSAERQRRLGRSSRAVDDETARAFALTEMRALTAADEALSLAEREATHYPEGRANAAYHRGDLARVRGELRRAIELLAGASEVADRIGYARLLGLAVQLRALVLVDTGRAADALVLLDPRRDLARRLEASLAGCDRADLANNRGWAALVLAANTSSDAGASFGPLREAESGYAACTNPRRLANARVNLAWAHLLAGDPERAKESLHGARVAQPRLDTLVALFADDLDARIALAEGRAEVAEVRFREVAERARALALPLDEARAEEGRARALFARKKLRAADEAAIHAQMLVEALAARIALGEGRGTFRTTRDAAARLRMEIALVEKDDDRAIAIARATRARAAADLTRLTSNSSEPAAAREARAQALATLTKAREALLAEAEHDWELPADAAARAREARREKALRVTSLYEESMRTIDRAAPPAEVRRSRPLQPGELDLVLHPVLDGWVALAVSTRAVRVARLDRLRADASGAELARGLVEPFDAELASATRVRVLASGAMRAADVHALPWRGRPLGEAVTVVYAADVARGALDDRGGEALVVVDPRVDLRAAEHEGELARAALARSGREVRLLAGPEATRAEVLAWLGRATFFHYAGHATHAGPDGWESALLLSRGTVLGVADLVTLERAPRVVVLSACDAAREVGAAGEEQVGIAQALLAAHASVVVAASRPVDDDATATLMNAFYIEIAAGRSPEDALARAQAALRDASPTADWASFRALVHGPG